MQTNTHNLRNSLSSFSLREHPVDFWIARIIAKASEGPLPWRHGDLATPTDGADGRPHYGCYGEDPTSGSDAARLNAGVGT